LRYASKNVVRFYNQHGTAEQWIKEGKAAIKWTRLSCRSFNSNAVRLQLHVLAYNLGNFLRTLAMPEPIQDWSLTSLREKLIKIGAKVVSHGRYIAFQMAEVAIPRRLFADILRLIAELRAPPIPATATWNIRADHVGRKTTREVRSYDPAARPFGAPGPKRASLIAKPAFRAAGGLENCRNHPASARKEQSYGESRLIQFNKTSLDGGLLEPCGVRRG
jgi:hypothetical protein